MKKFPLIIGVITAMIISGGVILVSKNSAPKTYPLPANLTYYWGDGCPHCKTVEEFLSSWEKRDKVIIEKKEIWGNSANAKELEARYNYCDITDSNKMGVPLLFTPDGKCFSGDIDIINYFKDSK